MKRLKKISKRTLKLVLHLTELVLAFVGVIGGLILYQLHISPMDGRFLLPELEKYVLPADSNYRIHADSVIVSSDWHKPGLIQIDIENMQILRPDDTAAVSLPKALFVYDFWDIVTLDYVPSMLRLKQPIINMIVSEEGIKTDSNSDKKTTPLDLKKVRKLIRRFLAFRRVDILDAQLSIQDLSQNKTLTFSDADLIFHRRFHFMEKVRLNSNLKTQNIDTKIMVEADINRLTKTLEFQAGVPKMDLSSLGHILPILKDVKFPTQISVKGELDIAKNISFVPDMVQKIQFNIHSLEKGTLNLPDPLTNIYPIKSLNINGAIGQGLKNIKIASSDIFLDYGTHATLDVVTTGLSEFLSAGDLSYLRTTLKSTVSNVPTEKIPSVWPKGVGTSSHEWVAESLSKGVIETADFRLDFKGDELVDLYGDILAKGVTVDYLSPMPKVDDVNARIYLYPDKVHILTETGKVGDLKLLKGDILLTDVDIDPSWAKIKLNIEGPVAQALKLLDSPPLEFPKDFGIVSEKASGTAQIETDLFFRLDTDIEPKDVQVLAQATLKNAGLVLLDEKLKFSNGNMNISVKDNILDLQGKAELFKIPIYLKWQEHFFPTNSVSSYYDISANISSQNLSQIYPNTTKWMDGDLSIHLTATQQQTTHKFSGQLLVDATDAWLHSFLLNATKEKSLPISMDLRFLNVSSDSGEIQMDILGKGDKNLTKNVFMKANVSWDKEFVINIENVKMAQNDFSALLKKSDKALAVQLKGKSLDLSDFSKMPTILQQSKSDSDVIFDMMADIHLDKVILNPKKPIQNFVVSAKRQSNLWQEFHAQADLKDPFILIYDTNQKQFQGSYADFGVLMDYLGLSDRFDGGMMSLRADQKDDGNLSANLSISKIQFKDPGFLIQALTILGIVDAFMGKDIIFDKMEVPFVIKPNFDIEIAEAYAAGTSLGITFTGDIRNSLLNLSGAVIPAYGINSLPGKIPLIGYLFRNSTGGGLINVPYSVTGDLSNPKTSFHPLGTITPGALGRLF